MVIKGLYFQYQFICHNARTSEPRLTLKFLSGLADASSDLSSADVIKDFSDGIDLIGLEDRSVSDLRWSNIASGTKIFDNATSKVLFLLDGIDASEIDHNDFIITDFV